MLHNICNPVNIGIIDFLNCLPINYTLEKWAIENIILSRGNPAQINKLMKEGLVDIAPISSIEYLLNQDKYILIKEACITSDAECGSVILFSNYELDELRGKKIALPDDSATSIAMLKVLLKQKGIAIKDINFVRHKYEKPLSETLGKNFDAALYIGNNALVARFHTCPCEQRNCHTELDSGSIQNASLSNEADAGKMLNLFQHDNGIQDDNIRRMKPLQYDLGRLWKDATGLPPVFGVWAAKVDWAINQKDDFEQVKLLISKAVEAGLGMYFNEIIQKAASDLKIPEHFIKDYLTAKIKYNFTSEHEESLRLFKELFYEII